MIQLANVKIAREARALDWSQRAAGGLPYGRGVVGRALFRCARWTKPRTRVEGLL